MQISTNFSLFILLAFIFLGSSLHLEQSTNSELIALKQRQQRIRDQVNRLSESNDNINKQLQTAANDKEKVEILQKALTDERQSLFDLKNKIIYPFNESETACQQLTQQQKSAYSLKIKTIRTQIDKLSQINKKLNQSSPQVQYVNEEIQKQYILLQQMEDILNVKCKQNLTPTIFQSNIKAKNWILGPQTMKDLKQQYAQRALIFHNITNCPVEMPFYDPVSQTCINCKSPDPIFNMFSKQCVHCQQDQQLDLEKRICKPKPHYTNFSKVVNWNLQGANEPVIDKNLTQCPNQKPYFNGVICIPCNLPFYWSVSANLCKKCQKEFSFDINTRKCEKIVKYELTILQNTKWVSQNLTKILQERTQILQKNKTMGNYQYCQSQESPYYDGTTCISCDYFDLDILKCVQKPNGTEYDANMKKFLAPQNNKQTNPSASRYISSSKLADTNLQNCNSSNPYYDGLACIECLKPFDVFNVDEKKCVSCNSDQIYVEDLHVCQARKKIRISQNFDRLMATPKVSVIQYKQKIIKTINDNPEALISPCQDKNQYSNFTDCFACQDNEYFNIQTLICVPCDGIYSEANQTCQAKVYIFTNLKASKIIDMDGTTVETQNSKIGDFLKSHPESYICPIEKPYAIENKTCGTCADLFSYSELICKSCPQYFIFVSDQRKCLQAKMLVNFTDAHRTLVSQTQTLQSFKQQEQQVKNENSNTWKICPGDKPFTSNRDSCFDCTGGTPYFNYTIKQCQNCPDHYIFDPATVRCTQQFFITLINSDTQPKMLGYDNYTLSNFKSDQEAYKKSHPVVLCESSQPFGTATGCQQCNDPTPYFDIKRKECSSAQFLINFDKIGSNYITPENKKIADYLIEEQKFRKETATLTKRCPDPTPYTVDRQNCFVCNEPDTLFNFQTKKCESCPKGAQFSNDKKRCLRIFYITNFNTESQKKMVGTSDYGIADYKVDQQKLKKQNLYKDCNITNPYGTLDGCKQCQNPQEYFDIKNQACTAVKKLINFDFVGNNYILKDGKSLADYQKDDQNDASGYSLPLIKCPSQTPYTNNREECFNCTSSKPNFNFETKACESCSQSQSYDPNKKMCIKKQYYTLLTPATQSKLLESEGITVDQFKNDQQALKSRFGSVECSSTKPYATELGCIECNSSNPYFNVKSKQCQDCNSGQQYFQSNHKCLTPFYLTDFTKQNLKQDDNFTIDDAKKIEKDQSSKQGYGQVSCSGAKPFGSSEGCIACNDTKLPYFNVKTRKCDSCGDYQYFSEQKCNKYEMLINTEKMIGYLQIDNYTKYMIEKQINLTIVTHRQKQYKFCPAEAPFFSIQNVCVACNSSQKPIFNLKEKICINVESLPISNTQYMKYYIETGGETMADLKNQIEVLKSKGVNVVPCPQEKPYLSHNQCIVCPSSSKYFDLAQQVCRTCNPGETCISL